MVNLMTPRGLVILGVSLSWAPYQDGILLHDGRMRAAVLATSDFPGRCCQCGRNNTPQAWLDFYSCDVCERLASLERALGKYSSSPMTAIVLLPPYLEYLCDAIPWKKATIDD